MTREEVEQKVKEVVGSVLGVDASDIKVTDKFVDMGADSIGTLQMIAAFEVVFKIRLDPDDAKKVQVIGPAIDYILKAIESQHGGKADKAKAVKPKAAAKKPKKK